MEVIEIGVDWLRLTTHDYDVAVKLENIAERAWLDECARRATRKQRSMLGYDGWGCEHIFFGSRADGWLLQITGAVADDYYAESLGIGANCTRIDLQVTCRLFEDNINYGKHQLELMELERSLGRCSSTTKPKLIDGRGLDGDTVQLGKRVSDKFGRLYDKYRQSLEDIYYRCWRYEVEYKGEVAKSVYAALEKSPSKTRIRDIVCSQWNDWGFGVFDVQWSYYKPHEYRRSSYETEKMLNWLAKQVAPSIKKARSNGVGVDEILAVLGLIDIDTDNEL